MTVLDLLVEGSALCGLVTELAVGGNAADMNVKSRRQSVGERECSCVGESFTIRNSGVGKKKREKIEDEVVAVSARSRGNAAKTTVLLPESVFARVGGSVPT
jgi:hypothetical protein